MRMHVPGVRTAAAEPVAMKVSDSRWSCNDFDERYAMLTEKILALGVNTHGAPRSIERRRVRRRARVQARRARRESR